jgi:large subunit ribosomal protein L3
MKGILAKKIGMTNFFDKEGDSVAVTVVEAGPCYVTQIKTTEKDGYNSVQIGFLPKKKKQVTKPLLNHFTKINIEPLRILREFKYDNFKELNPGDVIRADIFAVGENVNVTGISKGRGFAGVVKRHKFRGGPKTHGQSDRHRAPGSIGQSSSPSRVYKGVRMAGRMGNSRFTVKNLKIFNVDAEKNLLFIKGGVPGPNNGILEIVKK